MTDQKRTEVATAFLSLLLDRQQEARNTSWRHGDAAGRRLPSDAAVSRLARILRLTGPSGPEALKRAATNLARKHRSSAPILILSNLRFDNGAAERLVREEDAKRLESNVRFKLRDIPSDPEELEPWVGKEIVDNWSETVATIVADGISIPWLDTSVSVEEAVRELTLYWSVGSSLRDISRRIVSNYAGAWKYEYKYPYL